MMQMKIHPLGEMKVDLGQTDVFLEVSHRENGLDQPHYKTLYSCSCQHNLQFDTSYISIKWEMIVNWVVPARLG